MRDPLLLIGPKNSWLWAITPHHTRIFPLPLSRAVEAQVHSLSKRNPEIDHPLREQNQGREEPLRNSRMLPRR